MNTKIQKFPRGPFSKYGAVSPFPLNYNCKFVFSDESVLTSAITQYATGTKQEYRLNSPYDPNYTSAAAVPGNTTVNGFYRLLNATGPYTRYKVNAVKVDLMWYNPSNDGMAGVCHIKSANDSFDIGGGQHISYLERSPMTVVKRLNDSGSQRRRVVQYMPGSQLLGWTRQQFMVDMENTTGPYNSNPALTPRLVLAAINTATADARTIQYKVKITYFTTCYGRYDLSSQEAPV